MTLQSVQARAAGVVLGAVTKGKGSSKALTYKDWVSMEPGQDEETTTVDEPPVPGASTERTAEGTA